MTVILGIEEWSSITKKHLIIPQQKDAYQQDKANKCAFVEYFGRIRSEKESLELLFFPTEFPDHGYKGKGL